jgi:uncharacterized protein YfcZ (UPF0381/DUF406 family)
MVFFRRPIDATRISMSWQVTQSVDIRAMRDARDILDAAIHMLEDLEAAEAAITRLTEYARLSSASDNSDIRNAVGRMDKDLRTIARAIANTRHMANAYTTPRVTTPAR